MSEQQDHLDAALAWQKQAQLNTDAFLLRVRQGKYKGDTVKQTPTYKGMVELAAAATAPDPDPEPPPPPPPPPPPDPGDPYFAVRAVYDVGNKQASPQFPWCTTDFVDPAVSLGITHVVLPIADARVAAQLKAKGLQSLGWYLGVWSNGSKAWTNSDAQVTGWVNAVKDAGAGLHFYLADEPVYTPEFVAALNARIALVKSLAPDAVTVICDYTWSGRNQLSHWATDTPDLDEVWLSGAYGVIGTTAGHPGQYVQANLDYQIAQAKQAKALRPGLVIRGIIGMHNDAYSAVTPDPAYSGRNAVIPSFPGAALATSSIENQIQQQVDAYRSWSGIEGIVAFAYGPYPETGPPAGWTGWLRNRPDLCAEMARQFLRP